MDWIDLVLIYLVLIEYGFEAMEIEMAMQRDTNTMPSLQTMTPPAMLVCKQKMILK